MKNKIYDYICIAMACIGTLCFVGAVGAVETNYTTNSQYLGAGALVLLGGASFILSLYAQETVKQN